MGILAVCASVAEVGSDEPKPWTTTMTVASNTTLRLHWVHQYEGFDTVKRIDVIRGGKVVQSVRISGQPSFNKAKTFVAFPDCWDGGCSPMIRILNLVTLRELPPITFEREWFFKVAWEGERRLKVVLGSTNPGEKTEVQCFAVRDAGPSNEPLEPTGCAGRSAPG